MKKLIVLGGGDPCIMYMLKLSS